MSTKIYYAWRVPINKLNEVFDFVRPQIYKNGEDILRRLMRTVDEKFIHESKEKKNDNDFPESAIRFKAAVKLAKEVSKRSTRTLGVDVGFVFNVWLNDTYAYLILIGEYKNFTMPEWVEDYSYWDNVDEPEGLKEGEWEKRGEKWSEINCGEGVHSHNARRMVHSIIDLSAEYGDFDFEYEMRQRLIVKEKMNENGKI